MEVKLDKILDRRRLKKDDLKKKIKPKYLNRFALRIDDWKSCGILLDIPKITIEDIDTEQKRVRHKRIALLNEWAEKCGKDATYYRLAAALEELGRRDLIELLVDNFYLDQVKSTESWTDTVKAKGEQPTLKTVMYVLPVTFLVVHHQYTECRKSALQHGIYYYAKSHAMMVL